MDKIEQALALADVARRLTNEARHGKGYTHNELAQLAMNAKTARDELTEFLLANTATLRAELAALLSRLESAEKVVEAALAMTTVAIPSHQRWDRLRQALATHTQEDQE